MGWFTSDTAPSTEGWESSSGWDYDFSGRSQDEYNAFVSDLSDNNSLDTDWSSYQGAPDFSLGGNNDPKNEKSWYDSLTSPGVLSALITGGAGLMGGLSSMNMKEQELKASKEQQKMNQMLELAKLKYQLLSKGGGRSSGRSGSSGSNKAQDLQNQYSANQASGYSALGNNLASLYR